MAQLQACPLHPHVGAEIVGLDLDAPLDDETVAFLRGTFDEREILVFRGVDIDRAVQYALVSTLMGYPPSTPEEADAGGAAQSTFMISNKVPEAAAPFGRLLYHCDSMWSDTPFEVLSLFGVDVAPPVPPTQFVSATYAWDTLPDVLKARVEGLHALHVPGPEYLHERRKRAFEGELIKGTREHVPLISAPVVHRHPRTGRTMLYVTQGMTREILELPSEESEDLLEELFEHMYAPEVVYEHQWSQGDLVIWDNLATQHARPYVTTEGPARTFNKIGLPMPADPESHLIDAYQKVT
jgi:taurine dioxygenase